ncbi:MAG TPA: hypothetical protein VID50_07755 [Candidatus Eisenbacteria bacterium]|jgi:hypothetical protein
MRQQHPSHQAPRQHSRPTAEIYCRRDNRVYPSCPYVQAGSACPCLHQLETADALFEPTPPEGTSETTRG